MSVDALLEKIKNRRPVSFAETIAAIDSHYRYRPCRFSNGLGAEKWVNDAGSNEGACRIFAFAKIHGLDEQETLALFGAYYHVDVLGNPDGSDHKNIRNFMKFGWVGVEFEGDALTPLA